MPNTNISALYKIKINDVALVLDIFANRKTSPKSCGRDASAQCSCPVTSTYLHRVDGIKLI